MTARQFLYLDDTGPKRKLQLREEVLQAFLESDDVFDKPVAVISVAGAFRTGKSFLLDVMLRYLTAEDKKKWRDVEKRSFPWKNGADAHTKGMLISPPIKINLDSGKESALFLVDTQGLFDENSNIADATNIFALSTLLSSMQVFNLSGNLQSDDLDCLQLFAEIGRMARNRSDRKAFPDLLFLIRDWCQKTTHPFGKQGGDDLVQKRLRSDKVDLKQRRQHLEGCFENIGGFLMPHPGNKVACGSTFSDDDMDEEFVAALDQLLALLFSPNKIPLKMNGNRPVTCGQLAKLIRRYVDLFQSNKLPEPKSVLQTIAEQSNTIAVDAEFKDYVKKMNDLLTKDAPLLIEDILMKKHSEEKLAAVECLKNRDTVPDLAKDEGFYCSRLDEKIEEWFCGKHEALKKGAEEMTTDAIQCFRSYYGNFKVKIQHIKSSECQSHHDEEKQAALSEFERLRKNRLGSYDADDIGRRLEEEIDLLFEEMFTKEKQRRQAKKIGIAISVFGAVTAAAAAATPVGLVAVVGAVGVEVAVAAGVVGTVGTVIATGGVGLATGVKQFINRAGGCPEDIGLQPYIDRLEGNSTGEQEEQEEDSDEESSEEDIDAMLSSTTRLLP